MNLIKQNLQKIVKGSGFSKNVKFEFIQRTPSLKRQRKLVWFNPPYNAEVKTNIDKVFLKLFRKHFCKRHCYKEMSNIKTIKLSYLCTPNVKN